MESSFFENIYRIGVIPILEIDRADYAVPVVESLFSGGLPIAEITLRTDAALDSIRRIVRALPDILVGAGTVITLEQAKAVYDAGAKFIVSPGLAEEVIVWSQEQNLPIIAGAITPTEIMCAISLRLSLLKFFPAETMGGLKTIKSISNAFPHVRFIPTGGIGLENLAEYLTAKEIHAVGGSWMAKRQAINEGRFEDIIHLTKAARDVVELIRG